MSIHAGRYLAALKNPIRAQHYTNGRDHLQNQVKSEKQQAVQAP
jgi:hypothetical protein